MPKAPVRHHVPQRHRRRSIAGYARAHRAGTLTLIGLVIGLLLGAVAVATANAAVGSIPAGAVRAESFTEQHGARLEDTADVGGGRNVGWLANGDWMRYNGVDLGVAGGLTTSVRLAAAVNDGGTIEVRVDSLTGQVIASIPVSATGGWQAWVTKSDTATSPGGTHDVFLLIISSHPWDFVNVNWFMLGGSGGPGATPPTTSTPAPSPSGQSPAPTMSTTAPPPAPAVGWLPVDQARWSAQLAAFPAMTPRPDPGSPRRNAEFNATCTYSHSAPDDPIVFPGLSGASHMHSFIGNDGTNANTTTDDLMKFTASSCEPLEDHSAYWVPTLYEHGQPAEPRQVVVYYGSLLQDKTKTVPMPLGMRMIAGDAKLQTATPQGPVHQFYCAGGPPEGRERSTDGNWPVCDGGTLTYTLDFPDCWDGKHLDSPNHKQHLSFGAGGACPAAFPVPIPAVKFVIFYATSGTRDGFRLSSGMASSMHGDAFFAWEDDAMAHRVKDCVVQVIQCNTAGGF